MNSRLLRFAGLGLLLLLIGAGAVVTLSGPRTAVDAMAAGDYGRALDLYASAADAGNAEAQNALANLYYVGLGTDADPRRAAELYLAAASQGHAGAQLNLGHLYQQGLGVSNDPIRAYGWYRMSDIHGSPWAEYYITQTALEYTLSPMQMSTAIERYGRLRMLVAEGL